jgi:SAM-dependent methyltransferase
MGCVSGSTNGPQQPAAHPDSSLPGQQGLAGPINLRARAAAASQSGHGSTREVAATASTTGPMSLGSSWSRLVDSLAGDVILAHATGLRVLDLGHGSPEVSDWVRPRVGSLSIIEKSALEAPGRIVDASGLLPASEFLDSEGKLKIPDEDDDEPVLHLREYEDASFDLAYCLRTFPHLGYDPASSEQLGRQLLREAARVTVDGGTVFVQIANPRSLRGIVEGIRNPITVVSRRRMILGDRYGLTRWDTIPRFLRLLPPQLELMRIHGLGVLIPHDATLRIPIVGSLLSRLEWHMRDMALARRFGSQVLVALRRVRRDDPRLRDDSGRASLPAGLRAAVESGS